MKILTQKTYKYAESGEHIEVANVERLDSSNYTILFDQEGRQILREDYDSAGQVIKVIRYNYDGEDLNSEDHFRLSFRRKRNAQTGVLEELDSDENTLGTINENSF